MTITLTNLLVVLYVEIVTQSQLTSLDTSGWANSWEHLRLCC